MFTITISNSDGITMGDKMGMRLSIDGILHTITSSGSMRHHGASRE